MKLKWISFVLVFTMVASFLPTALTASAETGVKDGFLKEVTLPLPETVISGLMDEPEDPLPNAKASGFLADVEGWTPGPISDALPVAVTDPVQGAIEISTPEELQAMTAGNYVLTADIDMTDYLEEHTWTPINVNGSVTLDGQGHAIKGFTLSGIVNANIGLFSYVNGTLSVKDLIWEEASVTLDQGSGLSYNAGSLAGSVDGLNLQNFTATGVTITRGDVSSGYVGGLVGKVNGVATAVNCCLETSILRDITLAGTAENASGFGGVAGYVQNAFSAANCYVQTEINAPDASNTEVGGMVALLTGKTSHLRDIWVTGTITAANGWCGGLVGYHTSTGATFTAENCLSTLAICGQDCMGGLLGCSYYPTVTFSNCRYTGSMTLVKGSAACAGGLAGKIQTGELLVEDCAANVLVRTSALDSNSAYVGGLLGNSNNSEYELKHCAAVVSANGISTGTANIGGLVGYEQGTDTGHIQDCFAQLDAASISVSSGCAVGGLMGSSAQTVFTNCGANVNVSVNASSRAATNFGGLVGSTAKGVRMSRCYSSGSLRYTYAGTDESVVTYLGGLVGGGTNAKNSFGQCYGGTDIRVSVPEGCFNGNAGGLQGVGSQTTVYSSWSDASITVSASADTTPGTGSAVGGLVGFANGTVMDSCFIGTISRADACYLGGLVGRANARLINCYAETDLSGGQYTAGLIGGRGSSSGTSIYDSRYKGNIRNEGVNAQAAGLTTTLTYTDEIVRCQVDADIACADGIVGGMVAYAATEITIRDCQFTGRVAGKDVGGIAGRVPASGIYNCTVEGTVESLGENAYHCVGGIAAVAKRLENCHMLSPITISNHADGGSFGGVLGKAEQYGSTVVNCSSKGVRVTATSESYIRTNVGGIAGGDEGASSFGMVNCHVKGVVSGRTTEGYLHVGGIAGMGGGDYSNCSVAGNVTGSLTDAGDSYGVVCVGGIIGSSVSAELSSCYHAGAVSASAASEAKWVHADDPLVGYGTFDISGSIPDAAGQADETYTICTYYYEDGKPYDFFPLADADIIVNGVLMGKTGPDGVLTVKKEDVGNTLLASISAEKDGYFSAERKTILADGGMYTLYLCHKVPGKIYLRSATIELSDEEPDELLYTQNKYYLMQEDTSAHVLNVTVDWNDMQEEGRSLVVINEDESRKTEIATNGSTEVNLTSIFAPYEELYLQAEALDSEDNPVTAKQKLALQITRINVSLKPDGASADFGGDQGVYLLSGLGIDVNMDDLIKYGPEVTVENGVLKVDFDALVDDTEPSSIGLFNDNKISVGITGKLEVPVFGDAWGTWKGQLGITLGGELGEKEDAQSKVLKNPLLEYKYNTWLGTIPILFSTKIGAEASATIGFEGTWDDPGCTGELIGEGAMVVAVGPGFAYGDDLELSITGNGNIVLTFPIQYHYEKYDDGVYFNPSLEGFVSAVATLKAYDLFTDEGVNMEIKLGGFKWDKENGVDWYSIVNEAAPVSRMYLAEGSGFLCQEISLMDWTDCETGAGRLLYENILSDSRASMTVENDRVVLYFTADDGTEGLEGMACQHTALYKTVQQNDGSWSEPICISGAENGYPAIPQADGGFAVWVNSTDTDSLQKLLSSTDLHVLLPDGSAYTIAGQGDYLYAPKVAANGEKALVTWLSAEPAIIPENPSLHYAYFDGSKWNRGEVDTQGYTVTGAMPDWTSTISRVCWQTDTGLLMTNAGSGYGTKTVLLSGTAKNVVSGEYSAAMAADGTLTIWAGDTLEATLTTGGGNTSDLLLISDGGNGYCAVWSEMDGIYYADSASSFRYAKRLCSTDGQAAHLSGVLANGLPQVSYYLADRENQLHLFTAQAESLEGADLELIQVRVDDGDLSELGLMVLEGTVVSRREELVSGYRCTVTDEDGTVCYSGTVTSAELGYGEQTTVQAAFAPDDSGYHAYTITVLPTGPDGTEVADAEPDNNACTVTPASDMKIIDACFFTGASGEAGMEVYVGNQGVAPAADVTMEIYQLDRAGETTGEALVSETFTDVVYGSYRQVLLDNVKANTYYMVVLSSGDEVQDSTMLMWEDDNMSSVWIYSAKLNDDSSATVTLDARNWTELLMVCMAVYEKDGGRMICTDLQPLEPVNGMQTVNLDFSEKLDSGKYCYQVLLMDQETLNPVCQALTGTCTIPR